MPIDTAPADYFDTPERNERLQLVFHLLNNADEVPYLRAPSGAGKTRFALRLIEQLQADYAVVWLAAERIASLRGDLCGELGLDVNAVNWPGDLLGARDKSQLLVVIDNADALDLQALADLFELHAAGARLLLIGSGALAQRQGQSDLQFVDLPPFTEAQSLAFLDTARPGGVAQLGDATARGLHRAAGGWPGHLVDALTALPARAGVVEPAVGARRLSTQALLVSGTIALLLLTVLLYQDRINDWFEPPRPPAAEPPVLASKPLPPVVETAAPTPLPEPAPALSASSLAVSSPAPSSIPQSPPSEIVEQQQQASPLDEGEAAAAGQKDKPAMAAEKPAAASPDKNQVLDEVIDAAIAAAAQPPAVSPSTEPAPAEASQPPARQVDKPPAKAPALEKPKAPPSESKAEPTPAPAGKNARPISGLAWLKAQSPKHYTLQLVGARERAAIDRFIRQHELSPPYAVFTRQLNGRPWYSLVAGSYPDRDAAVAARAALPKALGGEGIWPRNFESVFKQMNP